MGDPINYFGGGSGVKRLSPREIEKMKKNMKKVPEIQLKSDIYHNQEVTEAEHILGNITDQTNEQVPQLIGKETQTNGHTSRINLLRQRFISLF